MGTFILFVKQLKVERDRKVRGQKGGQLDKGPGPDSNLTSQLQIMLLSPLSHHQYSYISYYIESNMSVIFG